MGKCGGEHEIDFGGVRRSHADHVRKDAHIRVVESPMVRGTVGSAEASPIEAEPRPGPADSSQDL